MYINVEENHHTHTHYNASCVCRAAWRNTPIILYDIIFLKRFSTLRPPRTVHNNNNVCKIRRRKVSTHTHTYVLYIYTSHTRVFYLSWFSVSMCFLMDIFFFPSRPPSVSHTPVVVVVVVVDIISHTQISVFSFRFPRLVYTRYKIIIITYNNSVSDSSVTPRIYYFFLKHFTSRCTRY